MSVIQTRYGGIRPSLPSKVLVTMQLPPSPTHLTGTDKELDDIHKDRERQANALKEALTNCAVAWIEEATGKPYDVSGYKVEAKWV